MQVLKEGESPALMEKLSDAWRSSETFALLPAKGHTRVDEVQRTLEALPGRFQTGHFCMLTSGSTGIPNLVVGNRQRSEYLAAVLHDVQLSEDVAATIVALPLAYCYAFINQWLWALVHDRKLIISPGLSDPGEFLKILTDAHDAKLCLVGSQVPLLLNYADGKRRFSGIIRLHFAGGRFPQEQLADLQTLFPNALIFNNYGCAEAMPRLTVRRSEEGGLAALVGTPIPEVKLAISREGEILFRSPYRVVARSVAGVLEEIGDDQWLPTGDVGTIQCDGQLLITGRGSEVFKRYGEKISVAQIRETISLSWRGLIGSYREVDPNGEQGYVLSLCPAPNEVELRLILMALRKQHTRPHWPLRIESVAAMPMLPNGKINNGALSSLSGCITHWRQRI